MQEVFKQKRVIQNKESHGIQEKSSLKFKKTMKKYYTITAVDLEGK